MGEGDEEMDHEEEILKCADSDLAAAVLGALSDLFESDFYLLEHDVSERTIAASLAWHLKPYLGGWDVDAEYNKHGGDPKKAHWKGDAASIVVPDIIVHMRGPEGPNVLVIEVKKSSNNETKHDDVAKLQGIKNDLGYPHALFLRFGVRDQAGIITECEWA